MVLVVSGVALIGRVTLFEWRYHHVGQQVLAREREVIARARQTPSTCAAAPDGGSGTDVDGVEVYGELRAESIGLDAPIVQGTGDAQLAVAVGHDPSSVWPSQLGTVVLSAHDVTWFSHIDALGVGSHFSVVTPCDTYDYSVVGTKIVKAGTAVLNGSGAQIVLTSCYPFTALYLTPDRYLVEADLQNVKEASTPLRVAPTYPIPYTAVAGALAVNAAQLNVSNLPVGALTVVGHPSAAWQQSPTPLAIHRNLLTTYLAALLAGEQANATLWSSVAPNVPFALSAPLWGATVSGNSSRINAVFHVVGSHVTSLSLTASPVLSGGYDPLDDLALRVDAQRYNLSLTAVVDGGLLHVTSFSMVDAGS